MVGSWEQSGQTVKAFCQSRGVRDSAFYSWRRELRRRDGQDTNPRRKAQQRSKGASNRFIQLEVTPMSSSLRICLADGLTIDVPATLDRQTLSEVIAAARMAASC